MLDVLVWLMWVVVSIVGIMMFLVLVYLSAKLWAYGSAMGRHRFEERKRKSHGSRPDEI